MPTLTLAHSPDSDDLVMWWPLCGMTHADGSPIALARRFRRLSRWRRLPRIRALLDPPNPTRSPCNAR